MIVILNPQADKDEQQVLVEKLRTAGGRPSLFKSEHAAWISVDSGDLAIETGSLLADPIVQRVIPVAAPWRLAGRGGKESHTVQGDGWQISSSGCTLIAGPCAVESYEQVHATATFVRQLGVPILRAGAYKPRTSPYSFQGLGREGLEILREVRSSVGIAVVTEAMTIEDLEVVADAADIVQIGARNMQNFPLLNEAGNCGKPVLLKRGFGSTLEELLHAAEYVLQGTPDVILCERGIRTFEKATRNTFDVAAIPALKSMSHLPVIADPSHAVGRADWVPAVARAAVAAGADAVMLEVHPDPTTARSDGQESLTFEQFQDLVPDLATLAADLNRPLTLSAPV